MHTVIKVTFFLFVNLKPRYHVVLKNIVDRTSLMACGNDGGSELKVQCVLISYNLICVKIYMCKFVWKKRKRKYVNGSSTELWKTFRRWLAFCLYFEKLFFIFYSIASFAVREIKSLNIS